MAIVKRDGPVDALEKRSGPDDELFGLEDMILAGMGDTIKQLRAFSGGDQPVADLGCDVEVKIGSQDPRAGWRSRLGDILALLNEVLGSNEDLDRAFALKALLRVDGWSWTSVAFRTPTWMEDHDEILWPEIVKEFKELAWIDPSSLETG